MNFESSYIYHVFNQGNNRQKIFFDRDNYLFFLKKINQYILPYADVLAWCLMPNHFHLMLRVNHVSLDVGRLDSKPELVNQPNKHRTLNNSIAIMLRSYTRAINKQRNNSGSLFRAKTKAECVNCPKGITPSYINKGGITSFTQSNPKFQYPQICFEYIHENPVKARLVKKATDWEFSSARDYANIRDGKLINRPVAEEFLDIRSFISSDLSSSDDSKSSDEDRYSIPPHPPSQSNH